MKIWNRNKKKKKEIRNRIGLHFWPTHLTSPPAPASLTPRQPIYVSTRAPEPKLLTIGPSPPCPSWPHTRRPAPRFVSHRLVEPISQHTHGPLHSPPSGPHTPGPSPSSGSMQRLPGRSPKSAQQPSPRTLGSASFPFTHIKLGKGLGRARRVPNHWESSHHWRVLP
jgi:hypothetical protein